MARNVYHSNQTSAVNGPNNPPTEFFPNRKPNTAPAATPKVESVLGGPAPRPLTEKVAKPSAKPALSAKEQMAAAGMLKPKKDAKPAAPVAVEDPADEEIVETPVVEEVETVEAAVEEVETPVVEDTDDSDDDFEDDIEDDSDDDIEDDDDDLTNG